MHAALVVALGAALQLLEPVGPGLARVDVAALSEPPGTRAELELPDGSTYAATVQGVRAHASGNRTWSASLTADGPDGYLLAVTGGERAGLHGTVLTPRGEYALAPAPAHGWDVVTVSQLEPPTDVGPDAEPWPYLPYHADTPAAVEKSARSDHSVFRLLLLYTAEARGGRNDDEWQAYLDHLMTLTNEAYERSGVAIEIRLVRHEPVAADDETRASLLISNMSVSSARFDPEVFGDVERWRLEEGAHFVTLLQRSLQGACGYAWVMPPCNGNSCLDAGIGYSMVSLRCDTSTLAHEIAHNLGSAHEPKDGLRGTFAHSHGHINDVPVRTVMVVGEPRMPRIARFSSPSLSCEGAPCGVANIADNVRSLNEARHQVERWPHERSLTVSATRERITRGGTALLRITMLGLLGGNVDLTLLRNGSPVAELYSGPVTAGTVHAPIPRGIEPGAGYRIRAKATLVPEFTATTDVLTVVRGSAELVVQKVEPGEDSVKVGGWVSYDGGDYRGTLTLLNGEGRDVASLDLSGPKAPGLGAEYFDHRFEGLACDVYRFQASITADGGRGTVNFASGPDFSLCGATAPPPPDLQDRAPSQPDPAPAGGGGAFGWLTLLVLLFASVRPKMS